MSEHTECRYDHHGHCDCLALAGLTDTANRIAALTDRLAALYDRRHRPPTAA